MKYSRLTGFEKHLEAAAKSSFSELYLILAKDDGERQIALDKLRAHVPAMRSYSAKEVREEEIMRELETFSLLQPKKWIHISEAHFLKKSALEWLKSYFEKPSPGVYLVLSFGDLKLDASFYKKAEKHGVILEMAEEKPWEKEKTVAEWLVQELASRGKTAAPQVIQELIGAVGTDMSVLLNELDKLVCFIGERAAITPADLQAIAAATSQETGWQLSEALLTRAAGPAFKIVRGLFAQEISFFLILRQIRSQFQTAFQIATSSQQDFPKMKDTLWKRHLQLAQAYGVERLPQALLHIDNIELTAKNGVDRYDLLADLLICRLVR